MSNCEEGLVKKPGFNDNQCEVVYTTCSWKIAYRLKLTFDYKGVKDQVCLNTLPESMMLTYW